MLWRLTAILACVACAQVQAQATVDTASTDAISIKDLERLLSQPVYGDTRASGAAKHSQDVDRAPAAVVIRTSGEIRAQGYRTLAEVLESMPGIHLQYDRAYVYGGVRGINRPGDFSSRLLVLVDGMRMNDALYEGGPIGREFPVDISLIDRVEFVPGPGSALYGSSALLGVVNVITRTASQLPGVNATAEYGTNANRKFALTWGGDLGGARLLLGAAQENRPGADLVFPEYDTPETNHGTAVDADGERTTKVYAKARWSALTVMAGASERVKNIPTGSYGTLFNSPTPWADRFAYVNTDYSERLDERQEVHLRAGVERYRFRSTSTYAGDDGSSTLAEADEGTAFSGEARYSWLGWRGHRLTVGIEAQRDTRQSIRLETISPPTQVLTDFDVSASRYAVYLNDEWQIAEAVLLNLGARTDRRLDGQRTTSPRVAAIWTPTPQWTLKWMHGSAFREPNAFERLYVDETQKSNSSLKVETLASNELVTLWRPSGSLTLESSLYSFRIRDLVELMADDDGLNQYRNRGELRSRGLELTATYVLPRGGQLRGSWSRQLVSDSDSSTAVSGAPQTLAKFAWTVPIRELNSTFGLNAQYVSERLTRTGQRLAGYVRTNAHLRYAAPGAPWSIALGIYNLTGERHFDPVGPEHLQDAIQQDGRELRVQLSWTY